LVVESGGKKRAVLANGVEYSTATTDTPDTQSSSTENERTFMTRSNSFPVSPATDSKRFKRKNWIPFLELKNLNKGRPENSF
jgi:hypothetical protein